MIHNSTSWHVVVCSLLLTFAATPSQSASADEETVDLKPEVLSGFIENHCLKCHGPKKQKGKLRLDTLSLKIGNSDEGQRWQDVFLAIKGGEMPPEDEPRPPNDEQAAVVKHLKSTLQQATARFGPGYQYKAGDIEIAAASAAEPIVESFNPDTILAAAKYLDDGAVAWTRSRKCITCHTNGTYMAERPSLTPYLGKPNEEVLKLFQRGIPTNALKNKQRERKAVQNPDQLAQQPEPITQQPEQIAQQQPDQLVRQQTGQPDQQPAQIAEEQSGESAQQHPGQSAGKKSAQKGQQTKGRRRPAHRIIWQSLGLAQWDQHVTGETSETTKRALRAMLMQQRDDGSWLHFPGVRELPHIATDFELATRAAWAVSAAPGWLDKLEDEELLKRVERMKTYLREHKPQNDYELALKLQLSNFMPDAVSAEQRDAAIAMLSGKQQADGGWSTRSMSTIDNWVNWHPQKGKRNLDMLRAETEAEKSASDPYMTGFAIVLLRESGAPETDEQIRRGIDWLKTNQRQSGRWWMKSMYKDTYHFSTYIGTAQALKALALCGELDAVTSAKESARR